MPIAYVAHQIPGRLRLRIPERRGDVVFFQRVVGVLSEVPDVTELDGSPLTGSVRIRYSGTAEAIAAAAAKECLFEIRQRDGEAQPNKPRDAGMLESIATGLSGLALFQVTQGQVTGSAAENFWNAYGAQRLLGRNEIAAGFVLLGLYQLLQGQWLGSASSLFFYALAARQLAVLDRAAGAMAGPRESPHSASGPPKPPRKRRTPDKPSEKAGASH
jgi:hypothetical protein